MIKYEVNFLPLFYVENIKISVYVKSVHNFNFFSESVGFALFYLTYEKYKSMRKWYVIDFSKLCSEMDIFND